MKQEKYQTAADLKASLDGYVPEPWTDQQQAMNSIMTIGQHFYGLENKTDEVTAPILAAIKDLRALNEPVDLITLADLLNERLELAPMGGIATLENILLHFNFVISMGEVDANSEILT
jgi:hypothetical protein